MKKSVKVFLLLFAAYVGYLAFSINHQLKVSEKEAIEEVDKLFEKKSEVGNNGGGGSVVKSETQSVERSPEVIKYFNEIAMNNEFGGARKSVYKWKTDMKIYVEGDKKPKYLIDELKLIVSELNVIIDPIQIKIVSSKDQANYFVYFGSHTGFVNRYDLIAPERVQNNWGYFEVYAQSGNMYVDLYRNDDYESHKHLLREELTQSLGLFNDSWEYPESIFYQGWTTTTEFAPIDRELIDMLYNN